MVIVVIGMVMVMAVPHDVMVIAMMERWCDGVVPIHGHDGNGRCFTFVCLGSALSACV